MKRIAPILMIALFIHGVTSAQETLSVKSVKASIQGTSSLHDWESAITQIEFRGVIQMESGLPKVIKDVQVSIPVKTIKSSEGKMMDNKTYDAFQSDTYPTITFVVSQSQVVVDQAKNISIKAPGKLTMAGTTKAVIVEARGKVLPNGNLQLAVAHKINMTEFNMKPPTAMLGTIKVGEAVTVVVDLILNTSHQVTTGSTQVRFE